MPYEFTQDDIDEHMRGLESAVAVIDSAIDANDVRDEIVDMVDRYVRHIRIMCAKPHLADNDLATYLAAAARGAAWLAR